MKLSFDRFKTFNKTIPEKKFFTITQSRIFDIILSKSSLNNYKALLSYLIISFLFVNSIDAQWQQLNVGLPGEVHVVAAIGDNVFAGSWAGIYRSTDQGKSWTNVSSYFARCFAAKGSEIFAGTYLNGVVRSTDGGITWNMTDTSMPKEIEAIAINGNYIFAGGGAIMLRSSNDGSSWTVIQNGLQYGQTTITCLVVTEGKILASTFAGVVVSTNNGNDWSTLVTTNSADGVTNCISVIDSTVLVGWPGGIIRSTDDGRTWYIPSSYIGTSTTFSIMGDSSRIYAGTVNGVHVSTDDGVTWSPINNGFPGEQALSIAEIDTTLFAASFDEGVFLSTNYGAGWVQANIGIYGWSGAYIAGRGTNLFAVMSSPTDASSLLYSSTDNGNTWIADTSLHSLVASITVTDKYAYAVTNNAIFESSDNGKSWYALNRGVMDSVGDTIYPRRLVKSGTNLIVATQGTYHWGKVFLSSDNGVSWKIVGQNLPEIVSLAAAGNYVYAGDAGHESDWTQSYDGIYRSTDNGENWTQINDTLKNISSLAASGSDIIAGRYLPPIPGTDTVLPPLGDIFLSTDNGQSWSTFENGLPLHPQVYSIAIYNKNILVGLSGAYANYSGPVYYSNISENSWTAIGDGLPILPIRSIYLNDSSVIVGTEHAGIWRMPLSGLTAVEPSKTNRTPENFKLEQNYPNPFNPTTVIEYSLPFESPVKLEIFDILGREISTLINKNQKAGAYSVKFNGGNLSSGVYFYRITAGNLVATKKLLIVK